MFFKLTIALVALPAVTSAANFKRVAYPDGKNTAMHEAVCDILSRLTSAVPSSVFNVIVLRVLRSVRRSPGELV